MTEYVSVDIEASGPFPPDYSMLSIGAVVVGNPSVKFYGELKPISDNFTKEALEVSGFTMEQAAKDGIDPTIVMRDFAGWIEKLSSKGKPKFVGYPAGFDWQFVNYYFLKYLGRNPFGIAPVDIRSVYFGMFPTENGFTIRKADMKSKLGVSAVHTHNALDDAEEQAQIFARMLEIRGIYDGTGDAKRLFGKYPAGGAQKAKDKMRAGWRDGDDANH
jgi:DNA polymerase III epsilon subunit-like protein